MPSPTLSVDPQALHMVSAPSLSYVSSLLGFVVVVFLNCITAHLIDVRMILIC